MNPWVQGRVEKLKPFITNMEHQTATQKKMLQTETSSNATEIEEITILTMVFQCHFISWGCIQSVLKQILLI